MRTVFNLLRATLVDKNENNWPKTLAEIEDNLNSTVHSMTGQIPAVLHLGVNPGLKATKKVFKNITMDNFIDPDVAVKDARLRMENNCKKQSQRFNATRYRSTLFQEKDVVAIENSQVASGGKLKAKFKGPYSVLKVLPNERYLLLNKGKRSTVAAHEQLRPWPAEEAMA